MYYLLRVCGRVVWAPERSYASCVGSRWAAVLAAAVVFSVVTVALAALPQLQFVFHGMLLHVALETAASLIAFLAGFLVYGRLRRCGGLNELLLACALAMLALVNLCSLMMPVLARSLANDLLVWVLLLGRSLGAILFALAAFCPPRRLRRPGPGLAASVAGGIIIVVLTAAVLHGFGGALAHRLAIALAPNSRQRPGPGGHPALLTLQLTTTVLYGAATVGFLRRSRRHGDEFFGWLALSGLSLLGGRSGQIGDGPGITGVSGHMGTYCGACRAFAQAGGLRAIRGRRARGCCVVVLARESHRLDSLRRSDLRRRRDGGRGRQHCTRASRGGSSRA